MTVEELIDSVDELKKEISTLAVDFRGVKSVDAKLQLNETLSARECELNKLLASQVKYVVEPVEVAPTCFLEYIQTEPWPKNFDCAICVIKTNNDPQFRASACSYCALTKPKPEPDSLATRTVKKVTSLFPVVFSEVHNDDKKNKA